MTYESFEPVELGRAEAAIEVFLPEDTEEPTDDKFIRAVAPYVEYDE